MGAATVAGAAAAAVIIISNRRSANFNGGEESSHHMKEPEFFEFRIRDMQVGDIGHTLPWAMCVDEVGFLWWKKRRYWIRGDYPVRKIPFGTLEMKVERREDGYHAWHLSDHCDEPIGFEIGYRNNKWGIVIRVQKVWRQDELVYAGG